MSRRLRAYLESCQQIEPLELSLLVPAGKQVRTDLGDLRELCASIREHGLLMPVLVRPMGSRFEVICGNRRLEACRRLMKRYVDCIVRDLSDQTSFEISLVENIQRQTLSPLEEARAFRSYVSNFGWGGITNLASRIGKSEEYVSHRILLLDLPKKILVKIEQRLIGPSQAQELLWFKEEPLRDQVLDRLEKEKLSVAEIRQIRKELESQAPSPSVELEKPAAESDVSGSKKPSSLVDFSHSADSTADFESPTQVSPSGRNYENSNLRDLKAIEEAILALRVALIRLDSSISKCKSRTARNLLMAERLSLHEQIDRLIVAKSKLPLSPVGEIT
jgi:ParB/RepB/Spo0J family partition protein